MISINTKELSDWVQYYKSNPAKCLQEIFGIKLFKYQELLINILSKTKDAKFYNNIEKIENCYRTYIKLLIHFMYMNDSDTVTIISPNKTEILDKEQFADYIVKFKNSKLLNVENINKFKEKFK